MPNREGQRFDDYQLLRLLGEGTFGEVYAAERVHNHKQVAIKIIKHKLSTEFLREVRAFICLKHPHIIPLLDVGISEPEQLPFLVMPFAPNGTLLQRHKRGIRLDLSLVVSYVEQLASALHYTHEQHFIHCDVKPANVLIGAQDELLLSDFGIVAIAHSEHSMRTQDVIGTAIYMAPEQIQGKPHPACDQYALAIMVYEWLCGTPPFLGSPTELFGQHIHVTPDPPRQHNPQLPSEVETVLLKALAKDPAMRFPSIQAFAHALSQANSESVSTLPALYLLPTQPLLTCSTPQPIPNETKTKEDWLNEGNELYNLQCFEEALGAFNCAIVLDPNFAIAYNNIGSALKNLKRYEEALDACNQAIALDPNFAVAYNNKGEILVDLTCSKKADRAVLYYPSFAFYYRLHQDTKWSDLEYYKEEALNACNQAIDLNPNYITAYITKGFALSLLERYEEALDAYNRAIQLNPNFAIAHNNKGFALRGLKRGKEARAAFAKARELGYKD